MLPGFNRYAAGGQRTGRSRSQRIWSCAFRKIPPSNTATCPVLRALAALNGGKPAKARDELQLAVPYELASFRGAMYPAFIRGEAFLAEHKGVEAAAEFQKLIDHRGIVLADPTAALVRLEIGRAWHLAGDDTKAKAAYRDFLALWKNADELPILKQAKAENVQLR